MRVAASILALAALSVGSTVQANSPPEIPVPQVVGGWNAGQVDAETRRVAQFALRHLHRRGARIRSVDAVDTQVVAGVNYRVVMTLTDRTRWQAVVWKRLDRRYQFTSGHRLTVD